MNEESTAPATENKNDVAQPVANGATNPAPASTPEKDAGESAATLLNEAKASEGTPEPSKKQDEGSKAEEGEGAKEKSEDKAEKPAEGAPEQYDEFKAPEGVLLDNEVMNQFGEVAKKLDLSQEKAQDVINELAPVMVKRQLERINAVSASWAEKSKGIPEIADHLGDVARLRDAFAYDVQGNIDPDIAEFMSSPAGNHPGVLKLLARAGRAFGEAGVPRGTAGGKEVISAKDIYHSKF